MENKGDTTFCTTWKIFRTVRTVKQTADRRSFASYIYLIM